MKTMKITYKKLVELFDPIIQFTKESRNFNKHLDQMLPSSHVVCELGYHLLDSYINLIGEIVGDVETINYYVFECDLGRIPNTIKVKDKSFVLTNLKSLWNFLLEKR